MQPCSDHIWVVHVVMAVFGGFSTLLNIWLVHRRKVADSERRAFYLLLARQMQVDQDELREILKNGETR